MDIFDNTIVCTLENAKFINILMRTAMLIPLNLSPSVQTAYYENKKLSLTKIKEAIWVSSCGLNVFKKYASIGP